MTVALAIDIGGTKLAAALVDDLGNVTGAHRVPTPKGAAADGESLWRTLVGITRLVLDDMSPSVELAGVGVGCGGPMAWPAAVVSPLNIPGWRGFPLGDRLRAEFAGASVRVHNDAICLAAAEHWRGAGRDIANMLGMVVSTGVGGGLVLGGRLVDGATGNAGHVGHVVVEPDGPACSCGGRGCLEAIASGPRLAAWATERGWTNASGDTARELAVDAAHGNEIAMRALNRAGRALGLAIASTTHLCDLELVVIGGGLSQAGPLLFEPLESTFRKHARMGFARALRIVAAELGQEAGLVGAAALVLAGDRYWSSPA